jgi:peptidoglycan L-alanyl-D-glutamate endopeptidase CwlK
VSAHPEPVDPEGRLACVHEDLAAVIKAAAQTPQPFVVVYGIRTQAAEAAAVASGHSETMHSRHLPQPGEQGRACAVDVCALGSDGALDWRVSDPDGGNFAAIAAQIQHAADTLEIPIEWGGAKVGAWSPGVVSTFHDWGHFQLPWGQYP